MVTASIWDAADPAVALAAESDNPTRAFQLDPAVAQSSDAGAHHGPFGSILKTANIASHPRDAGDEGQPAISRRAEEIALERNRSQPADSSAEAKETPAPMPLTTSNNPALASAEDDAGDLPPMPPMPPPSQPVATTADGSSNGTEIASSSAGQPRRDEADRSPRAGIGPAQLQRDRRPAVENQGIVRSSEQLVAQLHRLLGQGGTIRIAADAVLDLPAIVLDGTGRFQLLAEPGTKRPLLRFRPAQSVQRSPADWTVMVDSPRGVSPSRGNRRTRP